MSASNGHNPDDRFGDPIQPNGQSNGHANGNNGSSNGSSNRKHLSEISHLFLSEMRNRSGEGRTPPQRIAPGSTTPLNTPARPIVPRAPLPPLTAVVGAKLSASFVRHACAYAAGLATTDLLDGGCGRIGVVVVEASELRILCVDSAPAGVGVGAGVEGETLSTTDVREIGQTLSALAADVARWLIVLPDPRLPHARRLLARCEEWTLLTSADHEGVVSGYRTLKGLCEMELPEDLLCGSAQDGEGPRVTLAMLDAKNLDEADRAAKKLIGVCRQFLDLSIDGPRSPSETTATKCDVSELLTATWPAAIQAAQAWAELERRLMPTPTVPTVPTIPTVPAAPSPSPSTSGIPMAMTYPSMHDPLDPAVVERAAGIPDSAIPSLARPMPAPMPVPAPRPQTSTPTPVTSVAPAANAPAEIMPSFPITDEVFDLPTGGSVTDAALSAEASSGLAVTPIVPPMLPSGKVAVDREGRLTLVAAAAAGLSDLSTIARAVAWMSENRSLLAMALGQYRLSNDAPVALRLYVTHADAGSDALRMLLSHGSADVTVRAYRRLRWGGREGLLLEAA